MEPTKSRGGKRYGRKGGGMKAGSGAREHPPEAQLSY
jgi:hypothetical protein